MMTDTLDIRLTDVYRNWDGNEAAKEIQRLRQLVFDAYCEGFQEGKDGGWNVGPSEEPWEKSYVRAELEGGKK
jgi:hypothetical protein